MQGVQVWSLVEELASHMLCGVTKKILIFIEVQLLYNIVSVSAVEQSKSAIPVHISPLFWISFPFKSPQSTK